MTAILCTNPKSHDLHKEITAEDVAETALLLASNRSSKTTGAMFPVGGGLPKHFCVGGLPLARILTCIEEQPMTSNDHPAQRSSPAYVL
jgi:hypothetical protein